MIFTQFEQNFIDQGRKEGKEIGRDEREEEIIMSMIENGLSPEQISQMTNIPIETVFQIYNKKDGSFHN